MAPAEVVPSPQLMVARKALAGSTPPAWVKVATWTLLGDVLLVVTAPETLIAGSANDVAALALLLAVLGSGLLVLADTALPVLPSSVAWAVTVAVTVPPAATAPTLKVTTPPEALNVPWLAVADLKASSDPSVSVAVPPVASP